MTAETVKKEESMEDILHSIRDIIAGDEEPKDVAEPAKPGEEDVLELTEEIKSAAPVEGGSSGGDVLSDIDNALAGNEPAAAPLPSSNSAEAEVPVEKPISSGAPPAAVAGEPEEPAVAQATSGLVGKESADAATAAMKTLLKNLPKPEIQSAPFRSGGTVEDLVVETLKPMLSSWLDKNLPVIVRELVEREIRKLVPRE